MSFNRNKAHDRFNTRQMLKSPHSEDFGEKNWLDHGGAAGKIDQMLIDGASFEKILSSGRKPNAARSHLNHLKSEHGLPIEKIDGVYRFNFPSETDLNNETYDIPDEGPSNRLKEGAYLPSRDDFDNVRRRILRRGGKQISIADILDIMEVDLVEAGLSLSEEWRSVTRNNIILWTHEN